MLAGHAATDLRLAHPRHNRYDDPDDQHPFACQGLARPWLLTLAQAQEDRPSSIALASRSLVSAGILRTRGWPYIPSAHIRCLDVRFAKSIVLEPMLEYRAVKGRIQNQLKYHANVLTNSGLSDETARNARTAMRQLSCDLEERYYAIGLRNQLAYLRLLPSRKAISEAGSSLIFLSNAANTVGKEGENDEAMKEVRRTLGLLA